MGINLSTFIELLLVITTFRTLQTTMYQEPTLTEFEDYPSPEFETESFDVESKEICQQAMDELPPTQLIILI